MVTLKFILFMLSTILGLNSSFSFETGSSDSEASSYSRYERRKQNRRPVGRDLTKCSTGDIDARNELYDKCKNNFSQFGIQTPIDVDEIIERDSCDISEPKQEYFSGCGSAFLEIPEKTVQGVLSLLGVENYDQEIQVECLDPPTISNGLKRRINRGQGSEAEKQRFNDHERSLATWNDCADRVKSQVQNKVEDHKAKMNTFNQECRGYLGSRRQTTQKRNSQLKACMLRLAGENGCDACIQELSYVSPKLSLLDKLIPELKNFKSSQCFNKRALGKFACQIAMKGVGTATAGYSALRLAKLLGTSAVNRATAVAQSAARESRRQATTQAANRARSRVASEQTLIRNAGLTDTNRLTETTRRLRQSGPNIGDSLTETQASAILEAHAVGNPGAGIGTYTQLERNRKASILMRKGGFSREQTLLILDEGYAGNIAGNLPRNMPKTVQIQSSTARPSEFSSSVADIRQRAEYGEFGQIDEMAQQIRLRAQAGQQTFRNNLDQHAQSDLLLVSVGRSARALPAKLDDLADDIERLGLPKGWPATDEAALTSMSRVPQSLNPYEAARYNGFYNLADRQIKNRLTAIQDHIKAKGLGLNSSEVQSEVRRLMQVQQQIDRSRGTVQNNPLFQQ